MGGVGGGQFNISKQHWPCAFMRYCLCTNTLRDLHFQHRDWKIVLTTKSTNVWGVVEKVNLKIQEVSEPFVTVTSAANEAVGFLDVRRSQSFSAVDEHVTSEDSPGTHLEPRFKHGGDAKQSKNRFDLMTGNVSVYSHTVWRPLKALTVTGGWRSSPVHVKGTRRGGGLPVMFRLQAEI